MTLIKCNDCGKKISNRANICPSCGCPVRVEKEESKVIIYGLSQVGILGGKLKIYIDGEYVGKVKKGQCLEIPINKDCTITSKCGINLSRGKIDIKAGKTTKVKYEYDKLSGALIPCIVDEVTNTY